MPAPVRQTSTHSNNSTDLSPTQTQVVAALAQGRTVTDAAESAGLHRTTVFEWLKTSPAFCKALDEAKEIYEERLRGEMRELSALALKTLRGVMEDPKASPSVRLKASLAILNRRDWTLPANVESKVEVDNTAEKEMMQQLLDLEKGLKDPFSTLDATPRNAPCPCGSGLKFKRCCGVESPPIILVPTEPRP